MSNPDMLAVIGGITKRSIIYNGSMVLLMVGRLYVKKFLGIHV